jgi:SAM-dependent methyltransferase
VTFSSDDAREGWDAGAEAWEKFVEAGADYYRTEVHGPALVEACGEADGLRALDLGCGQGWFTRELARCGALVVGVDLSPAMVANARRHEEEESWGIEYVVMDAADARRRWPAGSFDLVTACMAIQDMADPLGAIQAAEQLLSPDGRLVFSVPHPFSEMAYREWERDEEGQKLSLKVDGYFETGSGTLHWNMERLPYAWETPRWRLTLSDWVSMLRNAGFAVASTGEPRPTQEQVAQRPELEDCRRLPYFLIFDARKVE